MSIQDELQDCESFGGVDTHSTPSNHFSQLSAQNVYLFIYLFLNEIYPIEVIKKECMKLELFFKQRVCSFF